MVLTVLTEAYGNHPPSASLRDIRASTEVARLVGCRVYGIRVADAIEDASGAGDAGALADALAELPRQAGEVPGVWVGYIPTPEQYESIYRQALEKGSGW